MPLDPALIPVLAALEAMPEPDVDLPISARRAQANAAWAAEFLCYSDAPPSVTAVADHHVAVAGGSIVVRVYKGSGEEGLPAHVYLHGGAFWLGTLEQFDVQCRELAALVPAVVVSVEYRLAPEHPFPAGADDCFAALEWVVAHAAELGADPARVSIGGGSAGANLATVVALMARDRGGPSLTLQVLEIPMTDCRLQSVSMRELGEGYGLTRAGLKAAIRHYLPDPRAVDNAYASPLLADDLGGLPAALVVTAEFDPLRDEGAAYAERLRAAGVPLTYRQLDGHIHGSQYFTALLPSARAHRTSVVDAIRNAGGPGGEPGPR